MIRAIYGVAVAGFVLSAACSGDADVESAATVESTAAPSLGSELVVNGSFEAGGSSTEGWEVSAQDPGQTAAVSIDSSGNRFVSMSASLVEEAAWPQAIATDTFPITPGRRYLLTLRARSDDFGLVIPIISFDDSAGDPLSGIGPGALEVTSPDWSTYDFAFEVPDGAATALVLFRLALNTLLTEEPQLSIEVDDVSLREIID